MDKILEFIKQNKKFVSLSAVIFSIICILAATQNNSKNLSSNDKQIENLADSDKKTEEPKNPPSKELGFNLSVGNLKLGFNVDDIKTACPDKNFILKTSENKKIYKFDDMEVTLSDGIIKGIVTYTDKVATEKGIRQGSNIEEVFSKYGGTCAPINYDGLILLEYIFSSHGNMTAVMRFAMKGSVVEYISLRLVDENEKNNLLSQVRNYKQELEMEKQRKLDEEKRLKENYHKTSNMTVDEFIEFYNKNVSVLGNKLKIKGTQTEILNDGSKVYELKNDCGIGFAVFTEKNSNKIDDIRVANEIRESASNAKNYIMIMGFAVHTFCNEKFVSNYDDVSESIELVRNLGSRVYSKNINTVEYEIDRYGVSKSEAENIYKGKKLYFFSVTDKNANFSSLTIKN